MSLEHQIAEFLQLSSDKYRLARELYRLGYGTLKGNNNVTQRCRKEISPVMMLKQMPSETESFTLDGDDIQLLEDNGIRVSRRLAERLRRSNRRKAETKRLEWGLRK